VSLFSVGAYKSSYNSDDVSQQTVLNTWKQNGTTNETYLTPDPWILKWPVYEVRQLLMPENSRKSVLIDSWIQNIGLLICLFITYRYFTDLILKNKEKLSAKLVSQKFRVFAAWLPFVWFYSLGDSLFSAFFRMPNTRNFELGILLLLFAGVHYIYSHFIKQGGLSKKIIALIIIWTIVSSVLFLSDPYCLIFLSILTISYMVLEACVRKKVYRISIFIAGALAVSIALYYLLKYVMSSVYGIHAAHTSGGLMGLNLIGQSLGLVSWSIGYINGIDYKDLRILNIVVPLGAALSLGYIILNRRFKTNVIPISFLITALAVVSAAVVSGNMVDRTSARYLVLTVPLVVLILGIGLSKLNINSKARRSVLYGFVGVLLVVIAVNGSIMVKSAVQTLTHSYSATDVNENATGTKIANTDMQYINDSALVNILDYKIIDTLKSKGLTKGYANYWRSNILTFLSNGSVDVNAIICEGEDRFPKPYKWLSTSEDYRPSGIDKSYIVYDDAYLNYATSCNKEKLGEPLERFNITSRVIVEVYKGDIARTF